MKKSDEFIRESVFRTNLNFLKLQNETKELFFECLNEGRNEEYFNKRLEDIWGKQDYSFMDREVKRYRELIHENNMQILELEKSAIENQPSEEVKNEKSFFKTATKVIVAGYVTKLMLEKRKEYNRSLKSPAYKLNKKIYLQKKVYKYDDKIVPYYKKVVKYGGKIDRYVGLNVYVSMLHNTEMTRNAWQQTLDDADELGYDLFVIQPHHFSCSYCREHQGIVMTRKEVEDVLGIKAGEQVGDILHPNCKCELRPYSKYTKIQKFKYTKEQDDEFYHIRQKTISLTLEKERLKTDKKIYEMLGDEASVDKINQRRNKINAKIRELKNELPTEELQKQVVAINRNY